MFKWMWSVVMALLLTLGHAQVQTVQGVVKDKTGEPLPGAEILNVDNGKAAITDFDGKFTIEAKNGDRLKVHYLGYKTKEVTVNAPNMVIILEPDAVGLEQVVITGVAGGATKKQLGSTIHTLKAEDLGQKEATTITEALQGQIAGAYIMRNNGSPDGNVTVRLRGPSTILGSSEPLIMIDGVIVNNEDRYISGMGSASQSALVDLDLEDIERIEVLKGPAASAIYGSIASNGIINIITKKGKTGEPTVSVTSKFTYSKIRKYKPLNTVKLYKASNGEIKELPAEFKGTPLSRYDWGKEYIFTPAPGYYNSAEIKGGTENTKYLISGGMLKNNGILRNSAFSRKNFRLRLNQKLNKWLELEGSVYYANTLSDEVPFGDAWVGNPMIGYLFGDNMVNPFPNEKGVYPVIRSSGGLKYLDYSGKGTQAWYGNPYEAIDLVDVLVNNNRTISNFFITARPLEGLKIKYTLGYDYTATNQHFRLPYNFTSDRNGFLRKGNAHTRILNSAVDASYSYKLGDMLKLTTAVGYNYLYRRYETQFAAQLEMPIFNNIQVINGDNPVSSGIYERALWGGYLQQVFNFDDKFFVTLAGRYDGASTFGKNQRNQFYPKASTSLVLSKFDFFQDIFGKVISEFKLRAAYGEAGNLSVLDAPSRNYMYLGTLYGTGNYLGQNTYLPHTSDGNKNIRPERSKEFEAGFDASFFDGKVGMEFTYYKQNIHDLVLNRVLAPSTGFSSRYENVGSMVNEGIELALRGTPVQTKDFKWDFQVTYSRNRNMAYNVPGYRMLLAGWSSSVVEEGKPIGAFYLFFYANKDGQWVLDPDGNPQRARGHYEDRDGDGFAETAVQDFDPETGQPVGTLLRKVIGDPHPDYIASLGQTFTYKNLSLRVVFERVAGFEVLDWDKRMAYKFPIGQFYGEELQLVKDGVKKPGWYSKRFYIWESFLEDGTFTKLREVSLTYRWKINSKYIKQARFTLSGTNLLSFDHYWGMDPEVNFMGRNNVGRSEDFGGVPIPRTYSLGVNLIF